MKLTEALTATLLTVASVCLATVTVKTWSLIDTTETTLRAVPVQVDNRLASLQATVDGRLKSIERTTDGRLAAIVSRADGRLESIQRDAFGQVDSLRVDLTREIAQTAETTRHHIELLGTTYAGLPDRVAAATTQVWDCESNPDCLENRYVSVSRAVESAARAVDRHGDRIAASLEITSRNTSKTTEASALLLGRAADYFTPPPKWARHPVVQVPIYFGSKLWPFLLPVF